MFTKHYKFTDFLLDILLSIIGSAIIGFSFAVFAVPNDIAPGGVSGLATALAYVTPITVGVWSLLLNLPLLVLAWRRLGVRSLVFTLLCTVLLSVFIDLGGNYLPHYTNSTMLASLYSGVLSGAGIGILFLRNISTGGTDLLALLLRKLLPNIPSGTLLLVADAIVVLIAVCVFRNVDVALYSTITIYVTSKVIDAITTGIDHAKVIYIITDKGEEMADSINENTDRGATIVPAVGGFTKDEKQMVMTVTRTNILAQTLKLIKQVDPKAFTFVVDSAEVHGEGFKQD